MKKPLKNRYLSEYSWYDLDNAAKMFPAISNSKSSNVFRITAKLKEFVDPILLQQAVEKALELMPAFGVKMHKGLFWYYFDTNFEKPLIELEKNYPCSTMNKYRTRGYLFRVTYYDRRINLEVFHALSDGAGSTEFLNYIVYYYFHLQFPDTVTEDFILDYAEKSNVTFDEDSFMKNTAVLSKKNGTKPSPAYHIKGYKFDGNRVSAIFAIVSTKQILTMTHSLSCSVSEYFCALLVNAIYQTTYRHSKENRPIIISLPVNLRSLFNSHTMRNFFSHINIAIPVHEKPFSFEEILRLTAEQLIAGLDKEKFEQKIAGNVKIEKNMAIRFIPLFIKNIGLKISYRNAAKYYTCTFSNLGRLVLPPTIADKVERFETLLGASVTHPIKVTLCSYKDSMVISFSSTIEDTSIQRAFITELTQQGIDVTISSNEVKEPEPEPKQRRKRKEKK